MAHKNSLASINKNTWQSQILILSPIHPACYQITVLEDCQRALVDESGVYLPISSFHHGSLHTHITWAINNSPTGGHSSET
jgi:hypothetical protein